MTRKEEQLYKLAEGLMADFAIICWICKRKDKVYRGSAHDAAEVFYGKGWRVRRVGALCPRCIEQSQKPI